MLYIAEQQRLYGTVYESFIALTTAGLCLLQLPFETNNH